MSNHKKWKDILETGAVLIETSMLLEIYRVAQNTG